MEKLPDQLEKCNKNVIQKLNNNKIAIELKVENVKTAFIEILKNRMQLIETKKLMVRNFSQKPTIFDDVLEPTKPEKLRKWAIDITMQIFRDIAQGKKAPIKSSFEDLAPGKAMKNQDFNDLVQEGRKIKHSVLKAKNLITNIIKVEIYHIIQSTKNEHTILNQTIQSIERLKLHASREAYEARTEFGVSSMRSFLNQKLQVLREEDPQHEDEPKAMQEEEFDDIDP